MREAQRYALRAVYGDAPPLYSWAETGKLRVRDKTGDHTYYWRGVEVLRINW